VLWVELPRGYPVSLVQVLPPPFWTFRIGAEPGGGGGVAGRESAMPPLVKQFIGNLTTGDEELVLFAFNLSGRVNEIESTPVSHTRICNRESKMCGTFHSHSSASRCEQNGEIHGCLVNQTGALLVADGEDLDCNYNIHSRSRQGCPEKNRILQTGP